MKPRLRFSFFHLFFVSSEFVSKGNIYRFHWMSEKRPAKTDQPARLSELSLLNAPVRRYTHGVAHVNV